MDELSLFNKSTQAGQFSDHKISGIEKLVDYYKEKEWFLLPTEIRSFHPNVRSWTLADQIRTGSSGPYVDYNL